MAEPVAASIESLAPRGSLMHGYAFEDLPEDVAEVSTPNRGMVPSLPRKEQPKEGFLEAKNARLTTRGIKRRDGTISHSAAPDALPVRGLVTFVDEEAVVRLIRVTPSSLYVNSGASTWRAYTYAPEGLGLDLRPSFAAHLDSVYMGGVGKVMRINFDTYTATEIPEAPRARFVTAFAERIVAAHISGDGFKLAWSENGDPTDWNGLGAGEENLAQSPSDFGDDITGIIGLESVMLILRRQTLWVASRQPFATAPFRFLAYATGFGCDMPHSVAAVPGGVVFADRRTRAIYFWQLGAKPQEISRGIRRELFEDLKSAKWSMATFDATSQRYILGLVTTAGSKVMEKFWSFSFAHGGWTYDDGPASTALSVYALTDPTMIDDLVGTIDALTGSIDDLSQESILTLTALHGRADGAIYKSDPAADTDADATAFEFDIQSLNLGSIAQRRTLQEWMATVAATRAGSIKLSQSKDQVTFVNEKTVALTANGRRERQALKNKPITGDDLYLRLRASATDVELQEYWAKVKGKGSQHA